MPLSSYRRGRGTWHARPTCRRQTPVTDYRHRWSCSTASSGTPQVQSIEWRITVRPGLGSATTTPMPSPQPHYGHKPCVVSWVPVATSISGRPTMTKQPGVTSTGRATARSTSSTAAVNARSDFNWAKLQGVRGHVGRHTLAVVPVARRNNGDRCKLRQRGSVMHGLLRRCRPRTPNSWV